MKSQSKTMNIYQPKLKINYRSAILVGIFLGVVAGLAWIVG
jgi:hypothetical protein